MVMEASMSDVVERLRPEDVRTRRLETATVRCDLLTEAADEIERLREALQMAVDWADRHDKEPSWLDAARAALKGNQ